MTQARARSFAVLLGIATIVVAIGSRWGIGASPDSAIYLASAESIAAGRGYMLGSPACGFHPVTHFPPLYPALLSAPIRGGLSASVAASVLQALLLAVNLALIGTIVARHGHEERGLLAQLLALTGVAFLTEHLLAHSEPLFLALLLSSVLLLARYFERPRRAPLLLAGAAIGLATLARYAGLGFIAGEAAAVYLFADGRSRARRVTDAAIFALVAVLPFAALSVRNAMVVGNTTGRQFGFRPASAERLLGAPRTFVNWIWPALLADGHDPILWASLALAPIGAVAAALVVRRRVSCSAPPAIVGGPMPWLCLILIAFYLPFLLVTLLFFDGDMPFDGRILLPALVLLLIVTLISTPMPRARHRRTIAVGVIAAIATSRATFAAAMLLLSWREGLEFCHRRWRESPMVAAAQALPPSALLYSNVDGLFWVRTDREACRIPSWDGTPESAASSAKRLRTLLERAGDARLVYFHIVNRPDRLSEAEAQRRLPLEPTLRTRDGAMYRLRDSE